jgi:HAD superfamily hydrolase (TIGR01509 family)
MAARLGVDEDAFRALWHAQLYARNSGALPDYRAALFEACRTLGVEPDSATVGAIYAQRLTEHAAIVTHVEPMILQTLAALQERGVPFGLVSNCEATEVTAWAESPLAPFFSAPVFSWQVGYAKPDRDIYDLACARLGVAQAEALFVGDGGSDELAGAACAGLTPYQARWFLDRYPEPRRRDQPYPILHAPSEVLALVAGEDLV